MDRKITIGVFMYSLIKGIERQPNPLLDLFTVAATPSKIGFEICDQCLSTTYMPVIDGTITYCIPCYTAKVPLKQTPTLPSPYHARKCDCGADKSNALGHYDWCSSGDGK